MRLKAIWRIPRALFMFYAKLRVILVSGELGSKKRAQSTAQVPLASSSRCDGVVTRHFLIIKEFPRLPGLFINSIPATKRRVIEGWLACHLNACTARQKRLIYAKNICSRLEASAVALSGSRSVRWDRRAARVTRRTKIFKRQSTRRGKQNVSEFKIHENLSSARNKISSFCALFEFVHFASRRKKAKSGGSGIWVESRLLGGESGDDNCCDLAFSLVNSRLFIKILLRLSSSFRFFVIQKSTSTRSLLPSPLRRQSTSEMEFATSNFMTRKTRCSGEDCEGDSKATIKS